MPRPSVSVIVPFAGTDAELAAVAERLAALARRDGDELLVADNDRPARPRGGAPGARGAPVRLIAAGARRSSYFARQTAAARATGEWLLFLDADCSPAADLLDAYFEVLPGERVAILAGAIVDTVEIDTLVARYVGARRKLDQLTTLAHPRAPYAQTANCAVRRAAFEQVGGFHEPVFSGGDADLCWRLQAAGFELESRPGARVRHRNRSTLRALLRQLHRHGAGMQWLDARYPGSFAPPRPRELAGRVAHHALAAVRAPDREARAYAAIDLLAGLAADAGRLHANGEPTRAFPSGS